jgi:hypothetical protein
VPVSTFSVTGRELQLEEARAVRGIGVCHSPARPLSYHCEYIRVRGPRLQYSAGLAVYAAMLSRCYFLFNCNIINTFLEVIWYEWRLTLYKCPLSSS